MSFTDVSLTRGCCRRGASCRHFAGGRARQQGNDFRIRHASSFARRHRV